MLNGGEAGRRPVRFSRSLTSCGPVVPAAVVMVSTGPWHVWHATPLRTCGLCGKWVNSGTLKTQTQGIGSPFAAYCASFWISGLSAAVILWQPRQRSTEGSPAYSESRASAWQLSWVALVISAALFASAPLVAILAVHLWRYGDRAPGIVLLHAWLARLGCPVVLGVCCMSIGFAWTARMRAQQDRESATIPAASLTFSVLATLAWLIVGYALLNTTESLIR